MLPSTTQVGMVNSVTYQLVTAGYEPLISCPTPASMVQKRKFNLPGCDTCYILPLRRKSDIFYVCLKIEVPRGLMTVSPKYVGEGKADNCTATGNLRHHKGYFYRKNIRYRLKSLTYSLYHARLNYVWKSEAQPEPIGRAARQGPTPRQRTSQAPPSTAPQPNPNPALAARTIHGWGKPAGGCRLGPAATALSGVPHLFWGRHRALCEGARAGQGRFPPVPPASGPAPPAAPQGSWPGPSATGVKPHSTYLTVCAHAYHAERVLKVTR